MFDERITEIIFFQTMYDKIKYIADVLDKPVSVSINNFFKLLKESNIKPVNIFDFNKAIDTFQTIKLTFETGHWQIIQLENSKDEKNISLNRDESLRSVLKKETGVKEDFKKMVNYTKKFKDKIREKKLDAESK